MTAEPFGGAIRTCPTCKGKGHYVVASTRGPLETDDIACPDCVGGSQGTDSMPDTPPSDIRDRLRNWPWKDSRIYDDALSEIESQDVKIERLQAVAERLAVESCLEYCSTPNCAQTCGVRIVNDALEALDV